MANGVVTLPLGAYWAADEENVAAGLGEAAREFIIGPENRLAAATIERLLDPTPTRSVSVAAVCNEAALGEPDVDSEEAAIAAANSPWQTLSPVILYGVPGCGKSHLAHGLVESWKRSRPNDKLVMLTASEFAQQYADAVDKRTVARWRDHFRSADLFVLEDLLQFSTKPAAQAELLHTLDALADRGALAVITSRLSPAEVPGLLAGLQSRLAAGLCVPLVLPDTEARRHILAKLAEARRMALSDRSLRLLARSLALPAAELSGALANLQLAAGASGQTLDDRFIQTYLERRGAARQPPLRTIATHTARHFALRVSDLRSASRRRAVVSARDVAMYLARQLTGNSLKQIGEYFGGRDHTTVLHGCRKTETLMRSDPATLDAVRELRQGLALG